MSSNNRQWSFLLWFTVCLWLGQSLHGAAGNTDLHQKMKYHLTELRKGLYEMQASHVHKRSANLNHDTIIYNSLLAFCSQMTLQNNSEPGPDTTTDEPPSTSLSSINVPVTIPVDKDDFSQSSKWPLPDPFPVKVQAERVGKKVWLVFDVLHSTPAYVARVFSFDFKKTDIDYPRRFATPVLSRIRFEVDASVCGDEITDTDMQADFAVAANDNSPYSAQVSVDFCMFDKVSNESGYNNRWEKKKDKIISQDIPRPLFKVLLNEGNNIVVEKGKNVTFEMDVHFFKVRQMSIYVRLWDRELGKVLTSRADVSIHRLDNGGAHVRNDIQNSNLENLLTVDVINETILNVTDSHDEGGWKNVSARVMMTINTVNGRRSGMVFMEYVWREPDYYQRPIVRSVRAAQKVLLMLPKRLEVLPRNDVEIFNRGKIECDEEGIKSYPKHGRNCTVFCHAFGTDIRSVIIKRPHSKTPPVRSVSYVVDNSAFAMWDVGPASRDIEGTYKCVVVTSSGKRKKKDFSLYTSQFTKVLNLTVKEFNNGSSRVICTASGAQPLNISISTTDFFSEEEDRSLDSPRIVGWVFTTGDERKKIIIFPTTLLKYPRERLNCRASGERGEDSSRLYLSSHIQNQNPIEAKIDRMPNATFVYDYGNGTVGIKCAATGNDLEMWLTRGTLHKDSRIDDKPENRRVVTETDEGKTLTLFMPRKSLVTGISTLYCQARNQFGDDWFAMYTHEIV